MKEPYVLAFDCSTPHATVALAGAGRLARRDVPHGRQAALLVPAIEEVMAELVVNYAQLDCMVSTVGPGSFTGLRIALAILHGLALATKLPVKTLTTPEAVAWGVRGHTKFAVALNAGKGELFLQEFTMHGEVPVASSGISIHPQAALDNVTLPCFSNLWPEAHAYYVTGPDAAVMARIAPQLPVGTLADAMPYYIRPADAKIPAKPSWLV